MLGLLEGNKKFCRLVGKGLKRRAVEASLAAPLGLMPSRTPPSLVVLHCRLFVGVACFFYAERPRACYPLAMEWLNLIGVGLVVGAGFVAPPEWTKNGVSSKYPVKSHLTGFAVIDREGELDAAKSQAAADLAARISVRIENQVSDVVAEKDGQQKYAVAALTKASTDVRLNGLVYETHSGDGRTFALAVLGREAGAALYRKQLADNAKAAKDKLALGQRAETDKREADALTAYLAVRPLVAEALEAEAIVTVLLQARDSVLAGELSDALSQADERVSKLLRRAVSSPKDAVAVLATQLAQQGVFNRDRRTVAPWTYGTTSFSSAFGRDLAAELDATLAQTLKANPDANASPSTLAIRGTYTERGNEVRIVVVVSDAKDGRVVASASAELAKSAIPGELALLPQNFAQALKDQKVLAAGEEVSGQLRVELWTNKGRSNLVYKEREELKLFMRVNRPAYVRLVYVLAKQHNGEQIKVPLSQSYYIDATKVNLAIEYPDAFEVSAPFGVEHVQAVAFTDKPDPLPTKKMNIDGEDYEVVGTADMVKHRGVKVKKAEAQTAEALISLTTTR